MSELTRTKDKGTLIDKTVEQGSVSVPESKPIIASARPGLAGSESALLRRLPSAYRERSVRDVLAYIVDSEIKDDEAPTAKSLRNELGAAGSIIVINGRDAKLTDPISTYLVENTRDVGGKKIVYEQLDIEVSAV